MSGTANGRRTAVTGRAAPVERTVTEQNLRHVTLPTRLRAPVRRADRLTAVEPGEPWTDDPYGRALRAGRGPLYLRRLAPRAHGTAELLPLDVERFCAAPDAADTGVLHRCTGPVLDVGCGPGRLVAALAARGTPALGVDVSPVAVARTRRLGGTALRRSVFDRLPGEGRWGTVLLMDGNVGIGGDPAALLARLRDLARPDGRLLAEAAPQDVDERLTVRVEDAHGHHGRPFPWARLGTTALLRAADAAGWVLTGRWTADDRPFLEFQHLHHGPDAAHPTPAGGPDRP
ncbi:methyltransferase domain-containing protein [Streptomyces sioyaensis]|uniref:Class I SAM-dependent methyltransferase n=1 Tax=Streptomyces sioyaensis TaxID=67364 RepID=A0A4Q1RBV0_9ACTN|nr:class I SAM-dependent methyltransferase [Streptomyces sioyaensis]MBM4793738.1 methyltransferase domain-containing protein [Streptomyces sioyaensis]RXS70928.1 class I SAM-dependent methyltransferase [Streptomyces sioyaensis]